MKITRFVKENIFFIALVLFGIMYFLVGIRINVFRYNNFDFGKFDLGNMTQMIWNTLHGRFLYLTDYFGTNLPRWSMSHVDPILLLFVPIFALFQHPLTLAISQLFLIVFSSLIIYKISYLELESKPASFLFGMSFLLYPAIGYINSQTGFHGVSAVIPFFLGAFYVFEKMYKDNNFSGNKIILFWILLILTMSGKEQIPLYVFMYGLFVMFYRNKDLESFTFTKDWLKVFLSYRVSRIGLSMIFVSIVWFITAFFIIIPAYAPLRIQGYENFAQSIGVNIVPNRDVGLDNYFLSRYDAFGDSYTDVLINVFLDHRKSIKVFFGGDKIENLTKTFVPLAFLPFIQPAMLMISAPDFFINYLTSAGGIGTAEIENHRISMIIPVLFISSIYAVGFISRISSKKIKKIVIILLPILVLVANIVTSFDYNNPVVLWVDQAIRKRVFAKYEEQITENIQIGDSTRISDLENRYLDCAKKIVNIIPKDASVSGPDYLGGHLSMRETYAIFPALWNSADYVVVDVFSRKLLTILQLDTNIIRDVVEDLMVRSDYKLVTGCGNLFVFKKVDQYEKNTLLPLQEKFQFNEKTDFEIYASLTVVDYLLPGVVTRGEPAKAVITYTKRDNNSLDGYVLYMTYVNKETEEIYQAANLPSFAVRQPEDWSEDRYYIEDIDIALPLFLDPGDYMVFVGMSNKVKVRNLYLGDIEVE